MFLFGQSKLTIPFLSPLENGIALYLKKNKQKNKNSTLIHPRMIYVSLLEISCVVMEKMILKRFFLIPYVHFLFRYYRRRVERFGCKNLSPNHLKILSTYTQLAEIDLVVLKRFVFYICQCILFIFHLPSEHGGVLLLNAIEFPSPNNDMCQVCLELFKWVGEQIFEFCQGSYAISLLSAPGKGRGHTFEKENRLTSSKDPLS